VIESPEVLHLLETASLFRGISQTWLEPLLREAKIVTLMPGEKLLSPGIPIAVLNPGDCVGEMSVLVDGMVSAYVIATTRCELLTLDYNSFWSLIDGSNEAARNMLNILVQRVRQGNEVMADSLLHHDNAAGNAIIDSLTGLYNHHGMHGKFNRLLLRCMTDKHALSLIVLEVDEFEKSKVGAGDSGSDHSLRIIAQTMLTFLRPDDHAARLIGKKFAVLLVNTSLSDACITAERLRTAISRTPIVLPNGNALPPLTISAGVCEALPDDTWNTLIARADVTLEQAISAGRNRVAHA
jgi:diguanylate cyclase (GGDEF)-like protein